MFLRKIFNRLKRFWEKVKKLFKLFLVNKLLAKFLTPTTRGSVRKVQQLNYGTYCTLCVSYFLTFFMTLLIRVTTQMENIYSWVFPMIGKYNNSSSRIAFTFLHRAKTSSIFLLVDQLHFTIVMPPETPVSNQYIRNGLNVIISWIFFCNQQCPTLAFVSCLITRVVLRGVSHFLLLLLSLV